MVKLHVKKGDQSQFLYETSVKENVKELVDKLVKIFNGRLKIDRLYYGKHIFVRFSYNFESTKIKRSVFNNFSLFFFLSVLCCVIKDTFNYMIS